MNSPQNVLYKIMGTTFFLLLTFLAHAQPDTVQVMATVDQLFTGMRTGDSSLVSQSFTTDATLQSVSMAPDGKVRVSKDAITGFTLIRTESGWKIASITDTRRKEECR